MMFYFFPFGLIPLLFIVVAARIGSRIYRDYIRDRDNQGRPDGADLNTRLRNGIQGLRMRGSMSIEARIFRLAHKMKGRLTLSDIVIETGLDLKNAEEVINSMVDSVRVRMEIDDRGLVVYDFPEIIARFERD